MIAALIAAAAVSAACDLEKPSGQPGCTRAVVDALPMNAIQAIGTHNSYKLPIAPNEMAMVRAANAREADAIDYGHKPLTAQLDAGARVLEIDIVYDPQPGFFAQPLGYRTAGKDAVPYDFSALKKPGLKVLHEPSIDYRATCGRFTDCLAEVRAWSKAHPDHVPLLIMLNLKEGGLKIPGAVVAPLFDAKAMDSIDGEIRAVFAGSSLITPDAVQGRHATLREAAGAGAWPKLKAARGKVMVTCDCPAGQVARYRGERKSLEGRAMFVNIDEASPAAAYITLNDPLKQSERIQAAVKAGLIVRTRADADTWEARKDDRVRQTAAFASGAQYVSTDYMQPDPRFGPYVAVLPGGGAARISPVQPGL